MSVPGTESSATSGGWGVEKVFPARRIMWNPSLGPPASGCGLRSSRCTWVRAQRHLRSGVESDGECKHWFGWSRRRELPEQVLDCPCLALQSAPTFHPHLPPQMPVPPLNVLRPAKLRGGSEEKHIHPPRRPLGFWTTSPPSLSPPDLLLVSLLWLLRPPAQPRHCLN